MDIHGFQGQGWVLGTMTPAGVLSGPRSVRPYTCRYQSASHVTLLLSSLTLNVGFSFAVSHHHYFLQVCLCKKKKVWASILARISETKRLLDDTVIIERQIWLFSCAGLTCDEGELLSLRSG